MCDGNGSDATGSIVPAGTLCEWDILDENSETCGTGGKCIKDIHLNYPDYFTQHEGVSELPHFNECVHGTEWGNPCCTGICAERKGYESNQIANSCSFDNNHSAWIDSISTNAWMSTPDTDERNCNFDIWYKSAEYEVLDVNMNVLVKRNGQKRFNFLELNDCGFWPHAYLIQGSAASGGGYYYVGDIYRDDSEFKCADGTGQYDYQCNNYLCAYKLHLYKFLTYLK